MAALGTRAFIVLQHVLPQHLLSKLVGVLARSRAAWIRRPLLAFFIRCYRPELAEALHPDPRSYASFNDFFTRALKPGARLPAGSFWPRGAITPCRRCSPTMRGWPAWWPAART
jgi:hypothetical protein